MACAMESRGEKLPSTLNYVKGNLYCEPALQGNKMNISLRGFTWIGNDAVIWKLSQGTNSSQFSVHLGFLPKILDMQSLIYL